MLFEWDFKARVPNEGPVVGDHRIYSGMVDSGAHVGQAGPYRRNLLGNPREVLGEC